MLSTIPYKFWWLFHNYGPATPYAAELFVLPRQEWSTAAHDRWKGLYVRQSRQRIQFFRLELLATLDPLQVSSSILNIASKKSFRLLCYSLAIVIVICSLFMGDGVRLVKVLNSMEWSELQEYLHAWHYRTVLDRFWRHSGQKSRKLTLSGAWMETRESVCWVHEVQELQSWALDLWGL